MPNTLGLDDDLDPVDALVSLEKAFALKINDEEAASCITVGDIYELLHSRFSQQIGKSGSCTTSMSFYWLRKSLRKRHPDINFKPDTPLTSFAGQNIGAFLDWLQRDSGLRLPKSQARWFTGVGYILAISAIPAAVLAAINLPPAFCFTAIVFFIIGAGLVILDPGSLPKDCGTLGDLAFKVSALNYGTLAASGGAIRPKALWDALTEVLSGHSDLPKSAMRRDTLILNHETK